MCHLGAYSGSYFKFHPVNGEVVGSGGGQMVFASRLRFCKGQSPSSLIHRVGQFPNHVIRRNDGRTAGH